LFVGRIIGIFDVAIDHRCCGIGMDRYEETLRRRTRLCRSGLVTDSKTGRSVMVIINDRGPFNKGRVLDLSTAAAKALGMTERGVVLVRAEVL
jgi:hypothetical protein